MNRGRTRPLSDGRTRPPSLSRACPLPHERKARREPRKEQSRRMSTEDIHIRVFLCASIILTCQSARVQKNPPDRISTRPAVAMPGHALYKRETARGCNPQAVRMICAPSDGNAWERSQYGPEVEDPHPCLG
jgi:hypothetical protein